MLAAADHPEPAQGDDRDFGGGLAACRQQPGRPDAGGDAEVGQLPPGVAGRGV